MTMSDLPTLLRVEIPNTEGAEYAKAGVQAWINSGVLVPVKSPTDSDEWRPMWVRVTNERGECAPYYEMVDMP